MRLFPLLLTALLLSPVARAHEEIGDNEVRKRADFVSTQTPGNGGWAFADSSHLPDQLQAAAVSRFTYSSSTSPSRPFASNLASPGGMAEVGGELGLTSWMSAQAVGVLGKDYQTNSGATGAVAGLRFSLFPRAWTHTQLVLNTGWLHELTGKDGVYGRVQLAAEFGRLRTQLSAHGEHVFTEGRDSVDFMLTAGVSMRLLSWLRLGLEYVGQDLEGEFDPQEAEGGSRHLLGPTVALSLLREKLSIVGGPAFALGTGTSSRVIGRMAVSYAF
jgi:hypothetical protein